jgi:hypothetical protein
MLAEWSWDPDNCLELAKQCHIFRRKRREESPAQRWLRKAKIDRDTGEKFRVRRQWSDRLLAMGMLDIFHHPEKETRLPKDPYRSHPRPVGCVSRGEGVGG